MKIKLLAFSLLLLTACGGGGTSDDKKKPNQDIGLESEKNPSTELTDEAPANEPPASEIVESLPVVDEAPADFTPPNTTASLNAGQYTGGQFVELTCNDGNGKGCDKTFYTLDSSLPDEHSSVYEGPIFIANSSELKFYSTDLANNKEKISSSTYSIKHEFTLSTEGKGVILSSNENYSCATTTCKFISHNQLSLELIAVAEKYYQFVSWEGCPSAEGDKCSINADDLANHNSIVAKFQSSLHEIYNIDFEAPFYVAEEPPTYGFWPDAVPNFYTRYSFGYAAPIIKPHNSFSGQVLQFQSQSNGSYLLSDPYMLPLKNNAVYYHMEMDLLITPQTATFKLFFNWPDLNNVLAFGSDSGAYFNGLYIGNYPQSENFNLKISADIKNHTFTISVNDSELSPVETSATMTDLTALRFYFYEPTVSNSVYVDNIKVYAAYPTDLTTPDSGTNIHIDFNSPVITQNGGQQGYGMSPYNEEEFNFTNILRFDRSLSTYNIPTNGTVHAGLARNLWPTIYHQLGYDFNLTKIDFATYNNTVSPLDDILFEGVKRSGEKVSWVINKNELTNNFTTFQFPEDWVDINHVFIKSGGISIDNIHLEITNPTLGFGLIE